MQVNTKKTNRSISGGEFINKVYALSKTFQRIRQKYDDDVDLLAKKYLKAHCAFKVGDIINIKDGEDGFTSFEIQKLFPHINWEKKTLRVKAYGVVTGEGKEPVEKSLWLDELNKVPAEAAKEAVEKEVNSDAL